MNLSLNLIAVPNKLRNLNTETSKPREVTEW